MMNFHSLCKSNCLILLLLFFFCFPPYIFAQETEKKEKKGEEVSDLPTPDTPELELPPILQELTDKSDAKLEAYIPELDIDLPSLEDEELPVPRQLDVDEAFTLEEIDISEVPLPSRGPAESGKAPWRSNGEIGLGSMSQVSGKIGIYSSGRENAFDLQFGYNRYDGFQFEPPGSGFFHQDLRLEGEFSSFPESSYLSFHGLYLETADGLQGRSSSFSELSHRFFEGTGSLVLGMEEKVEFFLDVRGRGVEQVLSGAVPARGWEIGLTPRLGMDITLSWFSINVEGSYYVKGFPGFASAVEHIIYPRLKAKAELPGGHAVEGNLGGRWTLGGPVLVPFSLGWNGNFPNRWGFSLSGGFRVKEKSYFELWQDVPYLAFGTKDPYTAGWFGEGELSVYPTSELTLEGRLSFDYFTRGVSESYVTTGLIDLFFGTFPSVTTEFTVYWDPKGLLALSAGWSGSFIEWAPLFPAHSMYIRADLGNEESRAGGSLSLETQIWEDLRMPLLDGSGFIKISENVRFILTGKDLLAPLIDGDRLGPAGYKTPGFRILLSAGISL